MQTTGRALQVMSSWHPGWHNMELVGRTWRTLIHKYWSCPVAKNWLKTTEKLLRFSPISCLSTYVKPWDFFFSPFNGGIVFSQNFDPFLDKKLFLQLREWNSIWGLQVIFEGNYFLRKWRVCVPALIRLGWGAALRLWHRPQPQPPQPQGQPPGAGKPQLQKVGEPFMV